MRRLYRIALFVLMFFVAVPLSPVFADVDFLSGRLSDDGRTFPLYVYGSQTVTWTFETPVSVSLAKFDAIYRGYSGSGSKYYLNVVRIIDQNDQEVYRKETSGTGEFQQRFSPPVQVKKLEIQGQSCLNCYVGYLKIQLFGPEPPPIPTGLNARPGLEKVYLEWEPISSALLSGYNVYQNGQKLNNTPITSPYYEVTGLTAGVTYKYNVTSVFVDGGESPFSDPAMATPYGPPVPISPTGLMATAGNGQVSLTWNIVNDPFLTVVGYRVYQDGKLLTPTPIGGTSYTVTGLENGKTYSFYVTAVSSPTDGSKESLPSKSVQAKPINSTPPIKPVGFDAVDKGGGTVELSWNANPEADIAGYNVYQDGQKIANLVTDTTFSVQGLTPNQTYIFGVTAQNTSGVESERAEKTITVSDTLSVNLIGNRDSIIVQIVGGIPPYSLDWGIGTDVCTATQCTIAGLEPETDYDVTVTDSVGRTWTGTVNTGNQKSFVPPVLPNPVSIFQEMIDSFGPAGHIAVAVILAAVALGVLCVLGIWGWRLAKRWLAASR